MRSRSVVKLAVGGLVLALGSVAGQVFADAPAPKWYDSIAIGGHIQGSYVGNLSKDTPQQNQLRGYDANNGFNLNQAQLRISKPLGDDGWGFTTKLLAGHDAGVIHSAGLGSSNDFDLEEAYVTFAVPKVKPLTFTGGKFVTACGVEVIESPLNMAIEPGLLFFWGMPFTHTGGKLNYTFNDKVALMGGLVNGWDQVVDGNPGKTLIWQLATTPLKGVTANLSGSYGPELFNSYPAGTPGTNNLPASGNLNISKRTHLDFVLGYTGVDKLSLNAEYLWGQDSNIGGTPDSGKGVWSGAGLWASYNVNDWINPGARFEVLRDQNGAGRLTAGVNQTAKELTVLNRFNVTKATFVRLEYRHDWTNYSDPTGATGTFTRSDGSFVRNQNTISADYVVTF